MRKILLLLSLVFLFCPYKSYGNEIDTYSQKCLKSINDPVSLSMLDTLYDMAKAKGDTKMMAWSYSTKIDYYYYRDNLDSIILHVDKTKALAKELNLPVYYYFGWNRLVYWYIKQRYLELAMSEIQMIQNEALSEGEDYAVAQSYQMMGEVFQAWHRYDSALDYYQRAIKYIEDKKMDTQPLFYLYNCMAYSNIELKRYDMAEKATDRGIKYLSGDVQRFPAYIVRAHLYNCWGKPDMARRYLDAIRSIGTASSADGRLYRMEEMKYQFLTGNTSKALSICSQLIEEAQDLGELSDYYSQKVEYEKKLGMYEEAMKSMDVFYSVRDSLMKNDYTQELGEQTIIYNLKDITAQKQKLELDMRMRWINMLVISTTLLLIMLVAALAVIIKIRHLNSKLQKSERIKSTFLQNLSHEVRTPLNSIMGFSEMLVISDDLSQSERTHFLEVIFNNSKLLMKLYSDALDASGAKVCDEKSSISINTCCREAMEMVKKYCSPDVAVVLDLCEGDATENIAKDSLSKILLNLLNNSAKFTKKGSITLKTEYLNKKDFRITITDTGPGIPIEKQDKVFDVFYSIDELSQGAGLGLSISKLFADSMKGKLVIDSHYVGGCRIFFTFPI